MTPLIFPSVYNSASIAEYFSDFFKLNEDKEFFNFRYFAKKIGWPLGYANDLISGRRGLTINRCMQFIEFSGLDPVESERFVYLCLKSNLDEKQRNLVDSKLPTSLGLKAFSVDESKKVIADEPDYFNEYSNYIVFTVLQWCELNLTASQIKSLIPLVDISIEDIENAKQLLIDKNIIQISPDGLRVKALHTDLQIDRPVDHDVEKILGRFAKSAMNFRANIVTPHSLNSGFIILPLARRDEILSRFVAFRNWLINYGTQYKREAGDPIDESFIFQYDINLFPVLDKEKAKELASAISLVHKK